MTRLSGPPGEQARFHDPKTLRRILASRSGVDFINGSPRRILKEHIEHPEFSGTVKTLMHKSFGVPTGGRKSLGEKSYQDFIWLVFEDEMVAKDRDGPFVGKEISDPEAEYLDREFSVEMREAVERLPRLQALLIKMIYLEEMPFSEVAGEFGISELKLSSHEIRALENLQGMPEFEGFGGKKPDKRKTGLTLGEGYAITLEKGRNDPSGIGEEKRRALEIRIGKMFKSIAEARSPGFFPGGEGFALALGSLAGGWRGAVPSAIAYPGAPAMMAGWKKTLLRQITQALEEATGYKVNWNE